jgi:hypothetical protein
MKRILAILTLVGLVLAMPLAATAGASGDDGPPQDQSEGIYDPPACDDDGMCDQQDTMGDPHDLGGGFRGTPAPPSQSGIGDQPWLLPICEFLMTLF